MAEKYEFTAKNKIVWLLWLQGWENAPWLQKQVVESWKINNPDWKIVLVSKETVSNYVDDIPYIYDTSKQITPQALSDIIRLSLLKNHGGIWADSTMLCMQPLHHWVHSAILASGFWMYSGHGGGLSPIIGPASWFIVSVKNSLLIRKWKEACDAYWNIHHSPNQYCWMDELFKNLYYTDNEFRDAWSIIPRIYCELDGQSHTLATHGMFNNTPHIKSLLTHYPPYALKLWKDWTQRIDDPSNHGPDVKEMNAYHAIQLSKRRTVL